MTDEFHQGEPTVPDDSDESYKEYALKESDETYTTIVKEQEEYDKQLLTLSSGLLAVLVAFLKDVVHLDEAVFKPLLYLGFAGLSLTIILVIISFQVSIYALERVRDYWKAHHDGNYEYPFPEGPSKQVKHLNWGAGGSFVAGVFLVFAFVTVNLSHQSQASRIDTHLTLKGKNENATDNSNGKHGDGWNAVEAPYDCPQGKRCTYKTTIEKSIGDENMESSSTTSPPAKSYNPRPITPGLPTKPPIKD